MQTSKTTDHVRCAWPKNELSIQYHDEEWGVPIHDDLLLYEALVLGGFQAGLSWSIVLHKREHCRKVFAGFVPEKVARFTEAKKLKLLQDPGIIRNRLKIEATVTNARAVIAVHEETGSFDRFLWSFVDGRPIINNWKLWSEVPTRSKESDAMSKELARRGFKFCGTTICYSVMQAVGMINDHTIDCFRHKELAKGTGARRGSRKTREV